MNYDLLDSFEFSKPNIDGPSLYWDLDENNFYSERDVPVFIKFEDEIQNSSKLEPFEALKEVGLHIDNAGNSFEDTATEAPNA